MAAHEITNPSGAPVPPLVIAGAGLAGYTAAREFRKVDATTPVVVVAADAADFYAKPKLSNALADGKSAAELVATPAAAMAAQLGITVHAKTGISGIDSAARRIETSAGALDYGRLVLALGADPIRLPLGGDAAGDVLSVNDLADYAAFRAVLAGKSRVVILGAGLIGCEFANDLADGGFAVTVVDPAAHPLASLVPDEAGRALAVALGNAGVRLRFGTSVAAVDRAGAAYRLSLDDGTSIEADVVLSAVGLRPRTALAQAAGLAVRRGIVVDGTLRTSAPDVFAIGDCAEIDGELRPYVLPIMHAAKALAHTLAGRATRVAFPPMPVVVKTPACPIVVQPVRRDALGAWHGETSEGNLRMRFTAPDGTLQGFVLAGRRAVQERSTLTRALGHGNGDTDVAGEIARVGAAAGTALALP
jgi:rubredoxin---NAD+ reductase